MSELPYISCLCVAGKDEFNLKYLLPQAVECFQRQTYPVDKRELVVVADDASLVDPFLDIRTRYPWVQWWVYLYDDRVRPSLGKLRNFSIDHATGPLCMQWDSDDWHHPQRIERQVDAYLANGSTKPVVLKRELCYSFTHDTAFIREFGHMRDMPVPIVGTILFPKNDYRYPERWREEDTYFYQLWIEKVVMDNDPCLYVRLEHGHNTWDAKSILGTFAADWAKGGWFISDPMREMLVDAIRRYPPEVWPDKGRHLFGWNPSRGVIRDIPMLETEDA